MSEKGLRNCFVEGKKKRQKSKGIQRDRPYRLFLAVVIVVLIGSFWPHLETKAEEAKQEEEVLQEAKESAEMLLGELEFEELNEMLAQLFPEEGMTFGEMLDHLVRGEDVMETIGAFLKERCFDSIRSERTMFLQILMLALIAAVFAQFSAAFSDRQIAETGFYMLYLLLLTILLTSFGRTIEETQEGISLLTGFMKVLGPVYFLAVAFATGSATSVVFYNLVLFLIYLVELLILHTILPLIQVLVLMKVLNHLMPEEYLSKFAQLLEGIVRWSLKTMIAGVIGVNLVQGLLAPATDLVKRSILQKGVEVIPGAGRIFGGMTEVALGSVVLIKNGIGVAGAVFCVLICAGPVVKMAILFFIYKLIAAVTQPISDRRITGCIESIADGCGLLGNVLFSTAVLFLITIVVVAASG